MTVETSSRKQTFAGAQTTLTFTFRALSTHPEYIKCKKVVVATGVESDLVYNTDFTVAVDSDGIGGSVTLTPTFSTAFNFVVYRETNLVQESDYDDFNQFPANTLETNFDQLTMIVQEQDETIGRVITFPISSSVTNPVLPTPEDGRILVWSGATGVIINTDLLAGPTGATGATGPAGPSGGGGTITSVSSNTSDIVVVSISTTPILTLNAATAGTNKILRLDAAGKLPALDGSQLTNVTFSTTSITIGTATITTDIYTADWVDYSGSSTVVGWTTPTINIRYRKLGRLVFVDFAITGTSNSTSATFTLPFASANNTVQFGGPMVNAFDNGSLILVAARALLEPNASLVTLYGNMGTGGWTAANTKTTNGSFWYMTA